MVVSFSLRPKNKLYIYGWGCGSDMVVVSFILRAKIISFNSDIKITLLAVQDNSITDTVCLSVPWSEPINN